MDRSYFSEREENVVAGLAPVGTVCLNAFVRSAIRGHDLADPGGGTHAADVTGGERPRPNEKEW